MYWQDEGYLLSKNNFDENSIIIEAFTYEHGKFNGIVYGGSSKKQKKYFQIGNKILLNWRSKSHNKAGYFNTELISAISPMYFDDKKRSVCILAAASILKILLPERQSNKIIYNSFEKMMLNLKSDNWIDQYIFWEYSLIKQLGFEIDLPKEKNTTDINGKIFKIPNIILKKSMNNSSSEIKEALSFNRNLIVENFIKPNHLSFPFFRKILESYYEGK